MYGRYYGDMREVKGGQGRQRVLPRSNSSSSKVQGRYREGTGKAKGTPAL
jgi:hypothetical protein